MNELVILFDVDNTLLDNDKVTSDLEQHLIQQFGRESAVRYWQIFEALRTELGYTDYLGAPSGSAQGLISHEPFI